MYDFVYVCMYMLLVDVSNMGLKISVQMRFMIQTLQ